MSKCLLVSEDDTFDLFIVLSQCEVELLMSPSALCCWMAIYLPPSLTHLSLYSTSIIMYSNLVEQQQADQIRDTNLKLLSLTLSLSASAGDYWHLKAPSRGQEVEESVEPQQLKSLRRRLRVIWHSGNSEKWMEERKIAGEHSAKLCLSLRGSGQSEGIFL